MCMRERKKSVGDKERKREKEKEVEREIETK
jgi:hypothetical protein